MLRVFFCIAMAVFISCAHGLESKKPLLAEQAFVFSSYVNKSDTLILEWQIAPGYYLYRDQVNITPISPSPIKVGKIVLPQGKPKSDELHGKYQAYAGTLKVPVQLGNPSEGVLNLSVRYQGCAADGFCYAPIKKDLRVNISKDKSTKDVTVSSVMASQKAGQGYTDTLFHGGNYFFIVFTFLGIGLLLAFTPCVLPMIPILSGIIVGHKHITTRKAFLLSLAYVLGMAITYAIAGMFVALIGSRAQTFFQSAWSIAFGSALFIVLAMSLFGFYSLELPSRWQKRLTAMSNKQKGGTYFGVFLMGVLSSLIVSPCVSAPLVGVLAYIADTGDMVLGALALLALGIGMGLPLLLIGASAGKLLPKSGMWMESIKRFFGILLLAVALWMISRIIPGPVALFLWAVLAICTAIFMGVFSDAKKTWDKLLRGIGLVLLIYGATLMIGALLGNSDPLRPLKAPSVVLCDQSQFVVVKNTAQLEEELAIAKHDHKPVIIDFFADWCAGCVSMDRYVFAKADVRRVLEGFMLIRADVTRNNAFDQEIMKRFKVVAPPTVIFLNPNGQELSDARIVGEVDAKEFIGHIQQIETIK